jgi:hypothetical protein
MPEGSAGGSGTTAEAGCDPRPDSGPARRPRQLRRLRRRAARIERREREEALSALESRGRLTDEQRETVRALAATLVAELTAGPAAALGGSRESESETETQGKTDRTRARTVGRLFELETG